MRRRRYYSRSYISYSRSGLKSTVSEMEWRVPGVDLIALLALRFHVPQHTAWVLPCALLSFIESIAQAKDNYPQGRERYRSMARRWSAGGG